jgi:hypothetical protein
VKTGAEERGCPRELVVRDTGPGGERGGGAAPRRQAGAPAASVVDATVRLI